MAKKVVTDLPVRTPEEIAADVAETENVFCGGGAVCSPNEVANVSFDLAAKGGDEIEIEIEAVSDPMNWGDTFTPVDPKEIFGDYSLKVSKENGFTITYPSTLDVFVEHDELVVKFGNLVVFSLQWPARTFR